jgi:hypothetical protein
VIAGIALYVLFGFIIWWLLNWYIDPSSASPPSTAKKDLMQAWSFIMAGAAGGIGIYFTWRNIQQGKEEQITERFTRAIEQLGSEKLALQLGGIYALERIANDSLERDYSTIMEVLTAYVRENAPRSQEEILYHTSESSKDKTAAKPEKQERSNLSADIQAILTVLSRRKKAGEEDDVVLDISATGLRGANLFGADLQEAVLFRTNLQEALLWDANLQGARLTDANLQRARLWEANLQRATLSRANLQGADLSDANLQETDLSDANLQNTEGLTQQQISKANGNKDTMLPDHLQRPAHWS